MLILFGMVILNVVISFINAWSVGRSWADSKAVGGWARVVTWSAAVMSACGFTWVYLVILALVARSGHWLPQRYVDGMLDLGYVVIILPVLGSGLAIWIDSLTTAWRQRSLGSGAIAAYNTFAMAHNVYEAATTLPDVVGRLTKTFSSDDDEDSGAAALAILLVIVALLGGVLTTAAIVRMSARSVARGVTSLRLHPAR